MDPIAFELFKNAIFSIADEMALTVFRTTYSGVLKDNMDYSTGFADAEGKLVAQGLTLPGHLGSVPTATASIMRLPVKVFGDLRAQLAACHIAEKQFAELVAKYGAGQTRLYMRETIDYAERLTRAALEKLPDGEWSFEDWIDDDGVDYGKPIRLFVTLRKRGGHMVVDWTGTHPQVKGAINNTLSFTKAASYTGVRSVLPQGIPNNEGVFRAIEVICPPARWATACFPPPA